jgi:Zn-dependent peptidase ImmA (M78 family)
VSRAHPTARKRFTAAHELGHVALGHLAEGAAPTDRDGDLYLFRATGGVHEAREVEANRFAAALLMPARLVLGEADRIGGTLDVRLLSERFWVSEAAMAVRLRDLLPQAAGGR